MKFYVIAGEASGDVHGANLMEAIKNQQADADFRFWGGDKMAAVAGKPVKHIKDLAFMGFIEVLANIRTILRNIKFCKEDILKYQPDAIILIDYPGFNLRIAEFAKQHGIKVLYYISPQVWAWKQKRVHKIKKIVDRMYTILPFEEDFYKQFDYEVDYVGHPLLDEISKHDMTDEAKAAFRKEQGLDDRPLIALFPGSRQQEISVKLPIMTSVIKSFPQYQFVVSGAPAIEASFYQKILKSDDVKVIFNANYKLLNCSHAALVTSGTATLETGLFSVPQVVCYKGNKLSYLLAKKLIKIKYISLVNLILDRPLVKELIQDELNAKNLIFELNKILESEHRTSVISGYDELKSVLGNKGASEKTASLMLKTLKAG